MASTTAWRSRTRMIAFLALLGALVIPAAATADVETFHRFEFDATANYTITETCSDGTTAETLVTVIGGHEEEAESGVTTLDNDFLTVLIRSIDCEGNFFIDRGSGPAAFSSSPSLQQATVTGTITTRDGRSVSVDIVWAGTGPIEVTNNMTIFDGFTGHFQGKRRDEAASGTVVLNEDARYGSTTNARLETLEDTNIRHRTRCAEALRERGLRAPPRSAGAAPERSCQCREAELYSAGYADVAQLARASACHGEGRGFESMIRFPRQPRSGGVFWWGDEIVTRWAVAQ